MMTNDEKLETVEFAGFFGKILNDGRNGTWPSALKTVADRIGVAPDENLARQMLSDFCRALVKLDDLSALAANEPTDDDGLSVNARLIPAFEMFIAGRLFDKADRIEFVTK